MQDSKNILFQNSVKGSLDTFSVYFVSTVHLPVLSRIINVGFLISLLKNMCIYNESTCFQ